jgi:hypothetical protein
MSCRGPNLKFITVSTCEIGDASLLSTTPGLTEKIALLVTGFATYQFAHTRCLVQYRVIEVNGRLWRSSKLRLVAVSRVAFTACQKINPE